MNRKDREKLARECIAVVEAAGGHAEIRPVFKGLRETDTVINARWTDLEAMVTIGGPSHPFAGVHFHSAKRDLAHHPVFSSINEFHFHKATAYPHHTALVDYLRHACAAIDAGEVFAQPPQETQAA